LANWFIRLFVVFFTAEAQRRSDLVIGLLVIGKLVHSFIRSFFYRRGAKTQ